MKEVSKGLPSETIPLAEDPLNCGQLVVWANSEKDSINNIKMCIDSENFIAIFPFLLEFNCDIRIIKN